MTLLLWLLFLGQNAATVDELMTTLIQATDMFQQQRIGDVREEEEREARERVKREQDEAYELSLQADRAKDEAKRAMEQEKLDEERKQRNAAEQAQVFTDLKMTLKIAMGNLIVIDTHLSFRRC